MLARSILTDEDFSGDKVKKLKKRLPDVIFFYLKPFILNLKIKW